MINTSEQIGELAAALAKAQAEIENVTKDGENPHFRSKYVTLAGVLDEARPKFAKHGISLVQMPINGEVGSIGVATRLLHASGQWIESTLFVAPTKFDAQGAGSTITYLRRYALMAMAGIAPEDDDGNAASIGQPQAPQRPQDPQDHPQWSKANAAFIRIEAELKNATMPAERDSIIGNSRADLEIIKTVDVRGYDALIRLSNKLNAEQFGATG